jgi:hypothetical protein
VAVLSEALAEGHAIHQQAGRHLDAPDLEEHGQNHTGQTCVPEIIASGAGGERSNAAGGRHDERDRERPPLLTAVHHRYRWRAYSVSEEHTLLLSPATLPVSTEARSLVAAPSCRMFAGTCSRSISIMHNRV